MTVCHGLRRMIYSVFYAKGPLKKKKIPFSFPKSEGSILDCGDEQTIKITVSLLLFRKQLNSCPSNQLTIYNCTNELKISNIYIIYIFKRSHF